MKYEFRGKTVKDAIAKGLKKLNLKAVDVDITILDEGLRGLFSIEGKQQAAVMIEPMPPSERQGGYVEAQKKLKEHVLEILARLGIIPDAVNSTMLTGRIYVNIICRDKKNILDEETLWALETLLFEIINKDPVSSGRGAGGAFDGASTRGEQSAGAVARQGGAPLKIHLDCNMLVRRKEEHLRAEALETARKTSADGKTRKLSRPLRFHYRKTVHDAVREVKGVSSRSLGTGDEKIIELFKI